MCDQQIVDDKQIVDDRGEGVEQAMGQGGRMPPRFRCNMGRDWTFTPSPLSDSVTVYGATVATEIR